MTPRVVPAFPSVAAGVSEDGRERVAKIIDPGAHKLRHGSKQMRNDPWVAALSKADQAVVEAVAFLTPFAEKCEDGGSDMIYGSENAKAGRALKIVLAALAPSPEPAGVSEEELSHLRQTVEYLTGVPRKPGVINDFRAPEVDQAILRCRERGDDDTANVLAQMRLVYRRQNNELQTALAALASPSSDTPEKRMLLDLLAVIHRDGGHYTDEHGLAASVADAMLLSSERLPDTPEIEALSAFTELMDFDLMSRWSSDGRQDFVAVVKRAKEAVAALATPNAIPNHVLGDEK